MTSSIDKEKTIEKWKSILDSNIGQLDHWAPIKSDYILGVDPALGSSSNDFASILPIAMRVSAQTIGLNLVNVQPMSGNSLDELERIKNEVIQENRDRAIDSILDDKDFSPMKIEEHPDYNSGPKGQLFYLDYKYNSGTFSLGEDNNNDI